MVAAPNNPAAQKAPAARKSKAVIIGSGPAGYTAAIYAARANLKPILIAGLAPGGQLTVTTDVENYPGFADVIQGPWLMEQMKAQAEHVGAEIVHDLIVDVDLGRRPFRLTGDSGAVYAGETLVIATGAQARWLGLASEEELRGRGVSACATCDGFFYRDKRVAVIGGGNTAVEEALFLTNFAREVTLVHRRHELRAEKILQDRLFKHPRVKLVWDHVADEILGAAHDAGAPKSVTGLRMKHVKTGATHVLPVDGVFVAIGHDPATSLFKGKLEMDEGGYIVTAPDSTATSVPGVFAAGDVKDKVFRQAVTAAGMGCMAALEANHFISAHALEDGANESELSAAE
jgi:thioredoxin reductase (NADPH)